MPDSAVLAQPQVWTEFAQVPAELGRTVVTVGVFDGVHLGHHGLLQAARDEAVRAAERLGSATPLPVIAVTFDPHPTAVVRPDAHSLMLTTPAHRARLLLEAGADQVFVLPFDADIASWSAKRFVEELLVGRLHAAAVVVGTNFRFGHRATGDHELLVELGLQHGFTAPLVALLDEAAAGEGAPAADNATGPVSSTRIRSLVVSGDVEQAAVLLGRPHRLEGVVVHGDHRGRELGYPTANLATTEHTAVPADGIYAAWLTTQVGARLPAALSIGTNPTFEGTRGRRVEAYVLDRTDLDLYGTRIAVDVVARLRGTVAFTSVEALMEQMSRDVEQVRGLLILD